MRGLRFTVPLVRCVIPLDSLQSQPLAMHNPASLPPHTLLRIIRIEKPLEAVLPKPMPSLEVPPRCTEPIAPIQAPRKKIDPTHTSSGTRDRKASSRRKKK
jgi:hypothetical protein